MIEQDVIKLSISISEINFNYTCQFEPNSMNDSDELPWWNMMATILKDFFFKKIVTDQDQVMSDSILNQTIMIQRNFLIRL